MLWRIPKRKPKIQVKDTGLQGTGMISIPLISVL
jgi:hypothetical protein